MPLQVSSEGRSPNSSSWPPNREPVLKKCGGTRVDWISNLPDDIIVHILSFLSLYEAAATSLLSHRWLDLWKYIPKLVFRARKHCSPLKYVNWVDSVLKSHKALSLQEFRINFYPTKSIQYQVAKWLEFAFSRRVETLDLCLDTSLDEILENITIPIIGMEYLQVLSLDNIKTSGDAIQFFLRNCPTLERLLISGAFITSDLEVVGSVKHLYISPRSWESYIKVSAPNLTSLETIFPTKMLFLESVPKLVNMTFRCSSGNTIHDFATAAQQLETLTITLNNPMASFSVPQMPRLKKLVVGDPTHINLDYFHPFPVTCFLRASPHVEEFNVEITKLTLEEGILEIPEVGPIF